MPVSHPAPLCGDAKPRRAAAAHQSKLLVPLQNPSLLQRLQLSRWLLKQVWKNSKVDWLPQAGKQ